MHGANGMKKSPARYAAVAAIAVLISSCVIYTFPGGAGPWYFDSSTSLPAGFTSSGTGTWTIDTTDGDSGSNSAKSGSPIGASSILTVTIDTLSEYADIHFSYKVSGSGSDYLEFSVNGVEQSRHYGTGFTPTTWSTDDIYDSYAINDGSEATLRWEYVNVSGTSILKNCAWIDSVVIDGQ
jgi:hypothetical protein